MVSRHLCFYNKQLIILTQHSEHKERTHNWQVHSTLKTTGETLQTCDEPNTTSRLFWKVWFSYHLRVLTRANPSFLQRHATFERRERPGLLPFSKPWVYWRTSQTLGLFVGTRSPLTKHSCRICSQFYFQSRIRNLYTEKNCITAWRMKG